MMYILVVRFKTKTHIYIRTSLMLYCWITVEKFYANKFTKLLLFDLFLFNFFFQFLVLSVHNWRQLSKIRMSIHFFCFVHRVPTVRIENDGVTNIKNQTQQIEFGWMVFNCQKLKRTKKYTLIAISRCCFSLFSLCTLFINRLISWCLCYHLLYAISFIYKHCFCVL